MASPTLARRIFSFSRDHQTLLYYAVGVCLLVAAAGLRFYDLPGNSLSHDEAAAANISRGAPLEVIYGTRCCNSSPILYPAALWAVQQVESTPFSVRLLPAAASVLTVAVLLFLLPRLGVNRWAAFLAALLATLSVAAIEHAQDAREYSLDALLAALLIAGLLWYLRDGRKVLLCVALFLAPLVQYGLVLFGVAVIGAAILLTPPPPPDFGGGVNEFIPESGSRLAQGAPGPGRAGGVLSGRLRPELRGYGAPAVAARLPRPGGLFGGVLLSGKV